MNILVKLTKQNLKLNRKRTIGTIIGIILSTALICAVSGMFSSFKETLVENSVAATGYYHIALSDLNEEDISTLKLNKDIKDIYVLYEMSSGTYEIDEDNMLDYYFYSLNEDDFQNLSYKITEGSFPSNDSEVLISEFFAKVTDLGVGDTITIQNKTYDITGITYRRRNSTSSLVITTNTKSDSIWGYIALKNPKDYKQSFVEILGANSYNDIKFDITTNMKYNYVINNELLRWEVFAVSDSTISALIAIVAVVIGIIVIVSVFCIRNSFAISTLEKMKMYGMLSSVGATKRQIKQSVLIEGLILGIISIPIGIFCGYLAVFILIKIVNLLLGDFLFNNISGIIFKVSIYPVILSIILSLITIYLSCISSAKRASHVSPIENLRNVKDIKLNVKKLKCPKIISELFKTGGVLAYKNLKRSKKKYRTTVISLTVSVFSFISLFYFVDMAFKQTSIYYEDYAYDIIVYLNNDDKEDVINKIKNIKEIDNLYIMYNSYHSGYTKDKDKVNTYDDYEENVEELVLAIVVVDDNVFKEYTSRLKLDYNNVYNKGILVNELRYWSNEKKKDIIKDRYSYKNGDIVNFVYENNEGNKYNVSVPLASVTYERPIGLENIYYDGGFLVVNKDYHNYLDYSPNKLLIDTSDSQNVVKSIEEIDDTLSIDDLSETVRNEKSMIIVISIFLYGFITVITLIGITNVFNTLTSNMELRQKEFAALKSIGMTKKEFNRMINLETIFYSSKSLIYGIVFGLIASYLIHLGFNESIERNFEMPFKGIIISVIFVFVIVFIIMKYSMNKINKQNIIETIRKDNI